MTFYLSDCKGCHNDARMNISIAISAARHGANVANHVKVVDLIKVIVE